MKNRRDGKEHLVVKNKLNEWYVSKLVKSVVSKAALKVKSLMSCYDGTDVFGT